MQSVIIYGISGALAFATEYISFIVIYNLLPVSFQLIGAQIISFCLALFVSFFGNKLFTFNINRKGYENSLGRQAGLFLLLSAFNFGFSIIGIFVITNYLHVLPAISKLIVMTMVVVWNFVIFKLLIFKSKSDN